MPGVFHCFDLRMCLMEEPGGWKDIRCDCLKDILDRLSRQWYKCDFSTDANRDSFYQVLAAFRRKTAHLLSRTSRSRFLPHNPVVAADYERAVKEAIATPKDRQPSNGQRVGYVRVIAIWRRSFSVIWHRPCLAGAVLRTCMVQTISPAAAFQTQTQWN